MVLSLFIKMMIFCSHRRWRTLLDCYMQVIEDDPKYWEVISSALAVGWLEIVVRSFYSPVLLFYQIPFIFAILRILYFIQIYYSDKMDLITSSCTFAGENAEVTWILSTRSAWKS